MGRNFPQATLNADGRVFANAPFDLFVEKPIELARLPPIQPNLLATMAITLRRALSAKGAVFALVIVLLDPFPQPVIELFERGDFIKNQRLLEALLQGEKKSLNLTLRPTVIRFGLK